MDNRCPCTHNYVTTNTNILYHNRANTYHAAVTNSHASSESGAGSKVHEVTNFVIVINASAGINNYSCAYCCSCIKYRVVAAFSEYKDSKGVKHLSGRFTMRNLSSTPLDVSKGWVINHLDNP